MAKRKKEDGSSEPELNLEETIGSSDPIKDALAKEEPKVQKKEENVETPEDVIEKLKKQLKDREDEVKSERERAKKAEENQRESQTKATNSEESAIAARESQVDQAIASAEIEITALEEQVSRLFEEGNSKEAVALNKKLTQVNYRQLRLTEHKEELKSYKEKTKQAAEAAKNQPQLSDAQREWIKKHPKYESDSEYRADTQAAHYAAVGRGYAQGSNVYLNFIDTYLDRLHGVDEENEEEEEHPEPKSQKPGRSITNFAAPSGRSNPSTTSDKKDTKLTPAQQATCREMGWDEETYKKNIQKAKARKEAR